MPKNNPKDKLDEFFTQTVSKEEFALIVRRFVFETTCLALNPNDVIPVSKESLSEGHYWLHQLSEILDPQLTKEV